MKSLLIYLSTILINYSVIGEVITIDNNASAGADFANIDAAISAASSGDTLHVISSPKSYGSILLSKKLTFIGPGHYPEGANRIGAKVEDISLRNGSSGSKFTGLEIIFIKAENGHDVSNISIFNNKITSSNAINASGSDGDNWVISGNVFSKGNGCGGCNLINMANNATNMSENWLITNNYIYTPGANNFSAT